MNIFKKIYNFLSSYRLAMTLLVTILACCVAGTTLLNQADSRELIFSTLWFNALLVLLVINVAFCFFGRIWRRKITLISFGMILFHLSFVAVLGGIVYNSLFYFRGMMMLTEGETLPNASFTSYDYIERGRFFNVLNLKGDTKLIDVRNDYKRGDTDDEWAYEIAVGEGASVKQDFIYMTKSLDYKGSSYYIDAEGYTLLIILFDRDGRELYGAYVPLQSIAKDDKTYLYTTGTKDTPAGIKFPQVYTDPLFYLQATYLPDSIKRMAGEAFFQAAPLIDSGGFHEDMKNAEGRAPIGEKVLVGDYYLSANEVRYWARISVHYEPGKPIVLGSLWVGLAGMILTFIGRLRRGMMGRLSGGSGN